MNTVTITEHLMPAAVQFPVPATFSFVEVYRAACVGFGRSASGVASVGVDAASHASDVWGIPCSPLVGSICTDTTKRRNTNTNTKANIKPATTLMSWLLRPSGVQGDPPV